MQRKGQFEEEVHWPEHVSYLFPGEESTVLK